MTEVVEIQNPDGGPESDPNVERASEVADAIDPHHTLPEIDIVPDPSSRMRGASEKFLIMHNGQRVGDCTILTDTSLQMCSFGGINVTALRQGFGSAAYKEVIAASLRRGFSFSTHDWTQSEGAKNVWEV